MTHAELVVQAGRWLATHERCSVVATELVTGAGEIPDAIGWRQGYSVLVECKASVSDFKSEQAYRNGRVASMGRLRYYLVPAGLIAQSELPARWGLLELTGCGIRVTKKSEVFSGDDVCAVGEASLLCSCLRRVFKSGCVEGLNVRCYTLGDANTGVATLSVGDETAVELSL